MRQTPLGNVRSMLKSELSKTTQDATATSQDAELNQIIWNVENYLATLTDWPFLKQRWDTNIGAGQRYLPFPTATGTGTTFLPNYERPGKFEIKWNQIWQPIVYGIDEIPEFNYLDSDRNQVLDPIQRWQFADEAQWEVWPLPASASQVRYIGQRQLTQLFNTPRTNPDTWNDGALLDLDDLLVVYWAALEYCLREKNEKATYFQSKSMEKLRALQGAYPSRTEVWTIGRGQPLDRKYIRQIPLVMIAGNTK